MAVTMGHPIAAIATGHGRSGIGILRMSGEGCIERAAKVFTRADGKPLEAAEDRKLVLGTMADAEGRPVDHCMAFVSHAPHSYTGEDTVEIQCHGSPAVLSAGLEALFAAGARPAGRGEFTKRAFLHGQLDLTQAEAVIDLIEAETADAAANAAGQDVDDELIAKVQAKYPWYSKFTIPAGTYDGQTEPVQTTAVKMLLLTDASMPDDVVYDLAKTFWENLDSLGKAHAVMKTVTKEMAVSDLSGIPLHPGAEKYYREIGLLK